MATSAKTASKSNSSMQRLVADAETAAERADIAKHEVRAAKLQLKKARKTSKAAKKSAKQARKKVDAAAAQLERATAAAAAATKVNKTGVKTGATSPSKGKTAAKSRTRQSASEVGRSVIKRLAGPRRGNDQAPRRDVARKPPPGTNVAANNGDAADGTRTSGGSAADRDGGASGVVRDDAAESPAA